ncbi:MAG: flagellar filament capping protein FliD [Clostridiales bacterium]|nr:flagellar filament capping protein FliD [Clostridiales bacterium]
MASISSLMGGTSASSSIYGSRNANIISGLGSGLDTESMIEGLVQSYQQKITGLQQDRTKVQWKQEAYQSVSDKMVEFYRTYMSFAYNSPTNLFSSSFFNSAVKTSAAGEFANLVSAVGKSNSEIVLNSVTQLAKAARYTTSGTDALINNSNITVSGGKITATGGAMVEQTHMSELEGSLTLKYGGNDQTVSIDLGALELMGSNSDGTGKLSPDKLKEAINKQLEKQTLKVGENSKTADEYIDVKVTEKGEISFSDKTTGKNSVTVTGASGKLSSALTAKPDGNSGTIQLTDKVVNDPTTSKSTAEALTGKTVTVTLDGKTKTFTLGKDLKDGKTFSSLQEVADDLTKQVNDAFGAGVKVGFQGNKLSFEVAEGSSLSVTSEASEALGLGKSGLTSYVNAGKTLGELLGDNMGGLTGQDKTTEKITEEKQSDGTITYKDANGHKVDKDGYFLNDKGEKTKRYDLTINGKTVGSFTKDDSLDRVMNTINNSDAGVKVQFSKTTGQFVFTAKDTGEAGRIEIKDNTLGAKLFGAVDPDTADAANYTKGQDAIFQVEVNGKTMNLSRSTNAVEIDGMTLNFKGTFNTDPAKPGEPVTFTSETDADTIVDAVKKMVEDYNKILDSVKDLYGTRPLTQGNGKGYEPLTAKDAEDMTETEIKNYEEKAKTGLLYMDSDLSSLYNSLRGVLTKNSGLLKSVGLSTEYSNGKTSLKLNETALRQALAENPESVKDAFVSSTENGGATDGLMAQMKQVVDRYAGTSGATKGILIEKAGSKYSPTAALNNTMLDKMNDIDKSIQKWQDKLSDRVDYYTNKFTQMEVLLQQMNSQSSALAGLMGG